MASSNKTAILNQAQALLKKRYPSATTDARLTVVEAVLLGICREGTTSALAQQGLARIREHFFDWNEARVSTTQEIERVLAELPDPARRAAAIRRFLRQLFEKTYGFNLEALHKKPLKEALKALREYDSIHSDYVLATVVQRALGGHAIPIDGDVHRALNRLGVADPGVDTATLRAGLERMVPKSRGAAFLDEFEALAADVCVRGEPICPRCELRKICPTGRERLTSRPHARAATAKSTKDDRTPAARPRPAKAATPADAASKTARPTPKKPRSK